MAGILNSGCELVGSLEGFDTCNVTNMVAEQGSSMDSSGLVSNGLFCVRDPDTDKVYVPNASKDVLSGPTMMGLMGQDQQYYIGDHTVDTGSGGELARDGTPDSSVLDVGFVLNKLIEVSENRFLDIERQIQDVSSKLDVLCQSRMTGKDVEKFDVGNDARKVKRLEDEAKEDEDDLDGHLSLGDAAGSKIMVKGTVDKWMVDRGFGFIKYDGETIFVIPLELFPRTV